MKVIETAKNFYSRAFTASEDLLEPYRDREQRLMNAMRSLNKVAFAVAVVVGVGEPALNVLNHPEVAEQFSEVAVYCAGSYAVAGAAYSVGLYVIEAQNDCAQEVA
jgi:hypothetical protein